MTNFNQDYDLFNDSVFNQYDDNFAPNFDFYGIDQNDDNNNNVGKKLSKDFVVPELVTSSKLAPYFNTKQPKKRNNTHIFKPPVKCKRFNDDTNVENIKENFNDTSKKEEFSLNILTDNNIDTFDTLNPNNRNNNRFTDISPNIKSNNFFLGGIISDTFNLLNEDNLTPLTQTSDISPNLSQVTPELDVSMSRNTSVCSVASLKTYKDLDSKSSDNIQLHKPIIQSINQDENNIKTNKIPTYEDLFKNIKPLLKFKKNVPMSIQFGDMGCNKYFSDYIKECGYLNTEDNTEIELKIFEMYPNENKIRICMKNSNSLK